MSSPQQDQAKRLSTASGRARSTSLKGLGDSKILRQEFVEPIKRAENQRGFYSDFILSSEVNNLHKIICN
jgi:hypothetical protein